MRQAYSEAKTPDMTSFHIAWIHKNKKSCEGFKSGATLRKMSIWCSVFTHKVVFLVLAEMLTKRESTCCIGSK